MAQSPHVIATTKAPAQHEASGFPPFDTSTYPSQIFWLTITFSLLLLVVWRIAGPRINAAISGRRSAINGAIAEATKARSEAEAVHQSYETILAEARANAQAIAEQTRHALNEEIAKSKAEADNQSRQAMSEAEAQIAASRENAKAHVALAARDSAIAIVQHLTGDRISAEQAQDALR